MYNNKAKAAMLAAIVVGLTSKRASRADIWAETYRVMGEPFPGPFSFEHHPWTREMLCDNAEECVGQKAAQMGFTDSVAINRAFFTLDKLRRDVLYVLPNKTPDATDFSAGRFNPALELSPYLAQLFTNVNNVALKRAGANSLYVRGSRSRSALKSLPVGLIILDEEDEFEQEAITLVRERISGQKEGQRQIWHISTPSIPGHGINVTFERSNKAHYFFPCPHCSRHVELLFPDSLTPDSYICTECKANITQEEKVIALRKAIWVPQYQDRAIHGYQINQMYSPVMRAQRFYEAHQLSLTSPVEEQEFYNSKLGEAHIVSGASVNEEQVESCVRSYKMRDPNRMRGIITMGIDVGSDLHVVVDAWRATPTSSADINANMFPSTIYAGTVSEFEELDNLMYLFKPGMAIIDHQPETRKALDFANRHPGRVKLCHYAGFDNLKGDFQVTVNRTAWLDRSLGRVMHGQIDLPMDIPLEFKQHLQRLVRVPGKDKDGNITYAYKKTGEDHYAHSRNYSEIALGCMSPGGVRELTERFQ